MDDSRQLQWIILNDFTPGIQTALQYQGGKSLPGMPLGAAQETDTHRCIALPAGGLGPLPKLSYTYAPTLGLDTAAHCLNGQYYVSGFHVAGPVLGTTGGGAFPLEFHLAFEYLYDSAGLTNYVRRWRWQRHRMWEASPTIDAVRTVNSTLAAPQILPVRPTWFADHRATITASVSDTGWPVVAASWFAGGSGAEEEWRVFPDPSNGSTVSTLSTLSIGFNALDGMISHQGRLLGFELTNFQHGPGSAAWTANEQIYFTGANARVLNSVIPIQFPYGEMVGFGAMKSVSVDELLLIKLDKGAFTVNGSIEDYVLVGLPGVTPTKGAYIVPAYTPAGLCYASLGSGVYAWQGGDSSKKISQQLESDFWQVDAANDFNNFDGKFLSWYEWLLVPNNWLYDTITESWWRIEPTSTFAAWQWSTGYLPQHAFAVAKTHIAGTLVRGFDKQVPASSYSWKGHPFSVTMNRLTRLRECIIVCHGVGTVTVTFYDNTGQSESITCSPATSDYPTAFRRNLRLEGTHLFCKIESAHSSTGAAPIVYEIRIGHVESSHFVAMP